MKTLESEQTLKAVRSGAWLGRFCVCARWDGRWVVVVEQTKADAHSIATAAVAAAVGIVMLPWCIVCAVLRWPCKPLYWGWVAWRNPAGFERIEQLVTKRPNAEPIHGE